MRRAALALVPALALGLGLGLALARPAAATTFELPPDGNMVGELQVVTASDSSTLLDIARHFDLGTEEIAGANPGVDVWVPKPGQRVVVPTVYILPPKPWTGLVVNVGARRFYYFPKPKHHERPVVITYPLGIARDNWPTPIGLTRIAAKVKNPSWTVPKDILEEHLKDDDPLPKVVPPGPDNPMGLLALRTAMPGIFIHGTNQPWGVGDRVSHGCMHLYPEDVAEIFPVVDVGTPVRILDEPFQVGERNGTLYMAGYAPLADYKNPKSPLQRAIEAVTAYLGKRSVAIDWKKVAAITNEDTTIPTPVIAGATPVADMVAALPAQPYLFPPYGTDANSAAPPPRLAAKAPGSETKPAGAPPTDTAAPAPPQPETAGAEKPPTAKAAVETVKLEPPPAKAGVETVKLTPPADAGAGDQASAKASDKPPASSEAAAIPAADKPAFELPLTSPPSGRQAPAKTATTAPADKSAAQPPPPASPAAEAEQPSLLPALGTPAADAATPNAPPDAPDVLSTLMGGGPADGAGDATKNPEGVY